jgi:hypothetical protein
MTEAKELTTKTANALAMLPEDDFSAMPTAEANDYKIPVLTVIQPTSTLEGTPGDVLDSNTKQKLFGVGDTVNFVPLWFYKDFAVYEWANGQRGKYKRREARSATNIRFEAYDSRIQKDPDGSEVVYMARTCFFVLLEKDLDQPMPQIYLLRYKGAMLGEGKNAIMCWDRAIKTKIRPYSMVMSVTPKMNKNDKGKFIVLHTANVVEKNQAKQIAGDQLVNAYNWHKLIQMNQESMATKAGEDLDETPAPIDANAIPF